MSGQRVAVAATGAQSLAAGLGVAAEGGGAVDAALAAAFVALATEPGMVSFGGGAYVAVWPADGDPVVVDGNVEMPGRGAPDERLRSRGPRGLHDVRRRGHHARRCGFGRHAGDRPGVRGRARRAHARLPWARLLAPATARRPRRLPDEPGRVPLPRAGRGQPVRGGPRGARPDDPGRRHRAGRWRGDAQPGPGRRARRAGRPTGPRCSRPAGSDGPWSTRCGDDGLVTAADLAAYSPVVRPAHTLAVGDWTIAVNPPPSVGGPILAVMLGELARRGDWTWADAIEVQHRVLGYRNAVHDRSADLEADGQGPAGPGVGPRDSAACAARPRRRTSRRSTPTGTPARSR